MHSTVEFLISLLMYVQSIGEFYLLFTLFDIKIARFMAVYKYLRLLFKLHVFILILNDILN